MRLLFFAVLLYTLIAVCIEGRYVLQVRFLGYNNPDQECQFCENRCCDIKDSAPCTGNSRCDTFFYYCLRAHGSNGVGCSYNGSVESIRNRNDATEINFNRTRILRLDNPLSLEGLTDFWNGVQLYIEARDRDSVDTYELIDVFELDHNLLIGDENQQLFTGVYNIVELELAMTALCGLGFTGPTCETNIDDCSLDACSENGACIDGVNAFTCTCNTGFMGSLCEDNFNDCIGVNCSGNGECIDGIDDFVCECYNGHTGQICEENIDKCVGRNCSEHGFCKDGVGTSLCVCDHGYTGSDCEVDIDECTNVNCSGHGYCIDRVATYLCICDLGFSGSNCEVDIDDCMAVNCSGNGFCVDGIDSFTCECNAGYQGSLCEIRCLTTPCGDEFQASKMTGAILSGVLGVLLSLIIILTLAVAMVFIMRFRKRQRNTGTRSSNGHSRALPKDNHEYDNAITLEGLPITNVAINYMNESTNEERADLTLEREVNNPIYGDSSVESVYTDPSSHKIEIISLPDHEFNNPIYGDDLDMTTHSARSPTDTSTQEVVTTRTRQKVYDKFSGREHVTDYQQEQYYDYVDL